MKKPLSLIILCLLNTVFEASMAIAVTSTQRLELKADHFTMADGLISNTVRSIIQDSIGYLWFGTTNGYSRYDGYDFIPYADSLVSPDMHNQKIVAYTQDGTRWLAVFGEGLHITNAQTGLDVFYQAGKDSPIISNNIKAIYADRSGSIWIGYEFYGLTHLRPGRPTGFHYWPMTEDQSGDGNTIRMADRIGEHLYIGNRNKTLYCFHANDTTFLSPTRTYSAVSHPYCVMEDEAGRLQLIGTRAGGIETVMDNSTETHQAERDNTIADDHIYSMHRDQQGRLWIGTFGGGLDLRNGSNDYRHFLQCDNDTRHIRDIVEEPSGRLWVSTGAGLYSFLPDELLADTTAYLRYNHANGALPGDKTRTLFIDSHQRLFVSVAGEGFVTADLTQSPITFQSWHPMSGAGALPIVQAFAEDLHGNIWVGTEHGLARFEPETGTFRNYFPSRQLAGNVFEEQTGVTLPNGLILFGSHQGLMSFDPDQLTVDELAPTVHLTALNTSDADVQMRFTSFNYAPLSADRFSYRLEGYDRQWSEPSVDNTATYKHLAPGHYVLSVRAISASGIEGEVQQFAFILPTPWYRTWWAWMLYLLILASIVYYIVRLNQEQERLRKRLMLDDQVKKEEPTASVLTPEDQQFRQRIDQIIEEELDNADFTVEDFASKMSMGRTLFFRRIKEVTGYSPKEYLRITRMNRAAQLLVSSGKNVSEVAYSVGMSDPLYFSKCFKQQFGVAPSVYAKNDGNS